MTSDLKKMLLNNKLILPADETVRFTIGRNPQGNVVLDFGKETQCLVLTPESTRELAAILLREVNK